MSDNQNPDSVRDAVNAAAPVEETIPEAVARLSALPPLEYEKVRKAEAEKLGIDRVTVLDKEVENARRSAQTENTPAEMFPSIEPYSETVDGAALLEEIAGSIRRFIVCDPETVTAATLWIVFTWLIDRVQVAPLAVITAPEKRCGKSQLLDLIGRLSRRPLVASNISPAAIFRVIEAHAPTLLIDEADAFLKDNEEARGILNSGHTRQSAYVIRVVGEDHIPTQFSTWGAKAISGIGTLADTLMDRAVVLELRRKLPHENVERLRHADPADFQRLTSMLARYSEDTGRMTETARPLLPDSLNDRAQDNWEPLLAIADNAGGNWPRLAREAALKISGIEQESSSLSAELLADIREVFETKRMEKISTADLLQELNADDLKPWAAYNRGKPMSPRQLAKRLGEYRIKPQTIRMGTGTVKGFQKAWFDDAFTRYLSPPSSPSLNPSVTSGTSLKNNDNYPLPIRNSGENVTAARSYSALNNKDCYGVTDAEVF